MYRLRDFVVDDLPLLGCLLPGAADTARDLRGHPGGLCGVVVEDPRGRICGCIVAARHELVTATRTIGLGIVRMAHVMNEGRVGGVHSLLFELDCAFAERCEGPDRALQAVVAQWDEADVWWFRRLRDYEPIAASLGFEGPVAAAKAPADVVVEGAGADAIAELEFGTGPVTGVRRSRESFAHAAGRPGRRAWIARRGAQVVAWATARNDAAGAVLEDHTIDWRDVPLATALLAAVAGGRPLRTTRWTDDEAELAALQAAGLRIRGPEQLIAARVSAFGLAPATVAEFASFGESDVGARALPRLSHNDRILTPPPPGTRNTQGDHRRRAGNHPHQPR
ncbi:MAG TPA: hypothetical protein VFT55_03670 [Planctomycetota bacterium]|nr:hypothetical protein [Planctomycetota bacterium]